MVGTLQALRQDKLGVVKGQKGQSGWRGAFQEEKGRVFPSSTTV